MKKILQLLLLTAVLGSCADKPKVCIINGVVHNRPDSKVIYIAHANHDHKANPNFLKVEIAPDGTFTDTIPFEHSVMYKLIFEDEYIQNTFNPTYFILEEGVTTLELYPQDKWENNTVKAGKLNKKYKDLKDESVKLFDTKPLYQLISDLEVQEKLFSSQVMALYAQFNDNTTRSEAEAIRAQLAELDKVGQYFTPEYYAASQKIESIRKEEEQWRIQQAKSHVDEVGLATLNSLYLYSEGDNSDLVEIFESLYKDKYSDNPMAQELVAAIAAESIVAGAPFVDFTAPDLQGKMVTLSDEINGKVAVIDLWASWCRPCIATSISFIPVWEKYKDQGFTIVAVAREKDNTDAMKAAIERHNIPWLNLVELNDRTSLWAQYGAANMVGRVVLVDRDGKIVDTDFDAARLEQHLEKLL